jgi:hypothetical protein
MTKPKPPTDLAEVAYAIHRGRGRSLSDESLSTYHLCRAYRRFGRDAGSAALRELEAAGHLRFFGRGRNRQVRLTAAGMDKYERSR